MSVLVEVVACTVDDAVRAEAAGAGRIELVSAISEGGLTPSLGTLEETKAACRIPVVAMLRPRGGGFVYTDREFRTMLRDAQSLLEAGADGLVVGILTPTGEIDRPRLREIAALTEGKDLICHRAFDLTQDPNVAIEALIELGFARILTNGQSTDALTGASRLRAMKERAAGRIGILPGGGVRASNAAMIARETGISEIHLGPFHAVPDPWSGDSSTRSMAEHLSLNPNEVRAVVEALQKSK